MKNLIPAIARRGYQVDLLHVRNHGPYLENPPAGVNIIDLGSSHVYPSLPAVVRYLRRERPVVMLSDKDRVNRTALLARALARVPTRVVVSSGTTISIYLAGVGPFERWLQRTSMGRLYPYADRIIVTSTGVADDMSAYTGLARERIEVVASPVVPDALLDTPQPLPDHPWFGAGQPPVILGVGELSKRKDFETLLRAFALVRAQRPCRLMILGRGKQREHLLSLATELGIAEDVALPGFVASPYAYMAHAAVFAFTSRLEGLGFVVIEALAMGTPVVSTDCPSGPREILRNGYYGPLVPVGDHQAMAQALVRVLEQPRDRGFLRSAAKPYTVETATDAYLQVFGLKKRADDGSQQTQ